MTKNIPMELTGLIHTAIELLGKAVQEVYGTKRYQQIERLREKMRDLRWQNSDDITQELRKELKKMKKYSSQELYEICHAFSIYMELLNRSEQAYRHTRLKKKELYRPSKMPYAIIYVFTAHPTEARSPEIMQLFEQIEDLMIEKLLGPANNEINQNLEHLINLALRISLSKNHDPSVEDEVWHIFSIVLNSRTLDQQIELKKRGINVNFRTWVGGDKDGHPYVNEKTLLRSLEVGRIMMSRYIEQKLIKASDELKLVSDCPKISKQVQSIELLINKLQEIKKLQIKDGIKTKKFLNLFNQTYKDHLKIFNSASPELEAIHKLLWLYPAIVLPLEIREDSEVIADALKSDKDYAIVKMIKNLKIISDGHNPKWYVRGLVISMTNNAEDISNGIKLIKNNFNQLAIPVVPLFETRSALEKSTHILKETFLNHSWLKPQHQKTWDRRFEIMLGYSDSSKESGVLASRYLIADALNRLDNFFKKENLTPVFFHGSGGSIERGGGSVKEQTSWWPKSSLHVFKATVQGEMVARNFGDPLIMRSHVEKILKGAGQHKKTKSSKKLEIAIEQLAIATAEEYNQLINSSDFIKLVQKATPYLYLDQLKIGSRPSKRQTGGDEIKLRAIPWVLCWTQTRTLLPTWFGVGSAWQSLKIEDKYLLMSEYKNSEFLISFTKILGFSLAKIEIDVFQLYLEQNLSPKESKKFLELFKTELQKTIHFFKEITREEEFLWFRPWLEESIHLRSSMIHPINLIQLIALERSDSRLLRESVTGVACGMLTTG